ncbi:LOW QUALITY PROTEIN: hypothetical protein HMPREF0005_05853, partial [Achromobacter xylosoxidans C54]
GGQHWATRRPLPPGRVHARRQSQGHHGLDRHHLARDGSGRRRPRTAGHRGRLRGPGRGRVRRLRAAVLDRVDGGPVRASAARHRRRARRRVRRRRAEAAVLARL